MIQRHGVPLKNAGKAIKSQNRDYKKMEYYAIGIRKFQRELNISLAEFPQFGLIEARTSYEQDPVNESYTHPYEQTQRDLEDYELQKNAIELEPNLLKEQAEDYKRIHRELMVDFFDEVW